MRTSLIAATLLASLTVPAIAFGETNEGRRLATLAFQSVDGSERGQIDHGQFTSFGRDVFVSMDADASKTLSLNEFLSWGFGMEIVAEDADRTAAYDTAMRVVFAFWDRDRDGQITPSEHTNALLDELRRADTNNDAFLSQDEFLTGFSVNIAARAAINPPPAN